MSPSATSSEVPRKSRWFLLLLMLWSILALRIGVAVVRGEAIRDDLSLAALAFFVGSAIIGSRAYGAVLDRKAPR